MCDVYYLDGEFVTGNPASLPVNDLLVMRGYGVFDFTRTYHKQAWYLKTHVERLFESAQNIDLPLPFEAAHVIGIVEEALKRSTHDECYVRMIVTGGDGLDSLIPAGKPRLIVSITRATPPSAKLYAEGIKAITVDEPRYLPGVKTLNYIPAVKAMKKARAADALEAIYLDANGCALEGTTTNLFIFSEGKLITPPLHSVLRGITREIVLELAEPLFPVVEKTIHVDDLYRADEVFITSSSKQIMPVTRVDDLLVSDGKPGDNTRKLMACFAALVEQS